MIQPQEVSAPSVIVFDVNETLSDLAPLSGRFAEVGAEAGLATRWFAALLRDGFALAAAGNSAPFAEIGRHLLREMLGDVDLSRSLDDAVTHILGGFAALDLHPDVAQGIVALGSTSSRLVTLSNGSAEVARTLLTRAGLIGAFEALLTVEDATAWKPARAAYDYAADACGVDVQDMLLIAVHPWDIHGAARAGLRTGWLNRDAAHYPSYFTAPDSGADRWASWLPSSGTGDVRTRSSR